jgi:hypothetical protein
MAAQGTGGWWLLRTGGWQRRGGGGGKLFKGPRGEAWVPR